MNESNGEGRNRKEEEKEIEITEVGKEKKDSKESPKTYIFGLN